MSRTGGQPLPAGIYYLLSDLLYRSAALTNSSGEIVEAYDTDAYGNTLIFSGPGADNAWFTNDDVTSLQPACETIFTGREYDPESQIYFYRARYYHPQLGRFVSRDPELYRPGPNLYQYANGTPTSFTDQSGLDPTRPDCCCGRDITTKLQSFLTAMRDAYSKAPRWKKILACFDFATPAGWDISQLYQPPVGAFTKRTCGSGNCANTVTVSAQCWDPGEVNYVLFGTAVNLCWNSGYPPFGVLGKFEAIALMEALIATWRGLGIRGGVKGRVAWAAAGFYGVVTPAIGGTKNCLPCTSEAPYTGGMHGYIGFGSFDQIWAHV